MSEKTTGEQIAELASTVLQLKAQLRARKEKDRLERLQSYADSLRAQIAGYDNVSLESLPTNGRKRKISKEEWLAERAAKESSY